MTRPQRFAVPAAIALLLAALAAPLPARADAEGDCRTAVQEKLERKAKKAKKIKFGNKTKSVSNAKKDKEEFRGGGTFVDGAGHKRQFDWHCTYKAGKVTDTTVNIVP